MNPSPARLRPDGPTRARRARFVLSLAVLLFLGTLLLPRIPQDEAYHHFADRRTFLGIPNALDVLSNIPFVLVGTAGLVALRRKAWRATVHFQEPRERWAWLLAFAGVAATGLGSAWYHLQPDTGSLFWDRLPMSVAFTALVAAVLAERVSPRCGTWLLPVLVAGGVGSVLYWRVTEAAGQGDLRLYGFCQYFPALVIPLLILLFPPRYTRGSDLIAALVGYGAAKLLELADQPIFNLGGVVSGHTLKHLAAALATYLVLRHLKRRRPLDDSEAGSLRFRAECVLKRDLLGQVERGRLQSPAGPVMAVRRDLSAGALWARPVAWLLARREARALEALAGVVGVPRLLGMEGSFLLRSFIPGLPLQSARPTDPDYYTRARHLLAGVHDALVTHNDTHKEPNWLITPSGEPALLDFQLASCFRRRTRWFRLLALEDLRHLLKHKRTYCPQALTASQRSLLARRSWPARWWRAGVKPLYLWITRRLLGWRDAEGHSPARPVRGLPGQNEESPESNDSTR